jgi:formylglycine-generating enzyme required for sulfatase activity
MNRSLPPAALAACLLCAHALAAAAPPPASFTNSLGLPFIPLPDSAVRICIYETRVADFQAFAAATGQVIAPAPFPQTSNHPVVNVTWEDATAFCRWLTTHERQLGLLNTNQVYRLPTDAEWTTAVGLGPQSGRTPEDRMHQTITWPWGASWPPQPGEGNYAPQLATDPHPHTAPVGSLKPSPLGLFDLGGNVWEWCEDWFNDARVTKVLRGASFNDAQPRDLLAAYRFSATVHLANDDVGFRLTLTPTP